MVVSDEGQVTRIHCDSVNGKHVFDLSPDSLSACFNAVRLCNGLHVVGVDSVQVQRVDERTRGRKLTPSVLMICSKPSDRSPA